MVRLFDRNMLAMMIAIMAGVTIITIFIADIVNQSEIDTITYDFQIEIMDVHNRNENFTNNFLQGSILMDSSREIREVGNYHFDFALFWYNTALSNISDKIITLCISNCSEAMDHYYSSYESFGKSSPYFHEAKVFTDKENYLEVLGYYLSFADAGQNITLLRYNASRYLRQAAENLSQNNMENVSYLMENFTLIEGLYREAVKDYEEKKDQIDGYLFFNEIREEE
jgi:hypothetical protein